MATIKIKGRNVPLLYTVYEMKAIQEEIGPLAEAINLVLGRNPEDEKDRSKYLSREHLEAATKLIRILGNAGLEEAGEAPNLTDKMIARAIRPVELPIMISACMDAMNAGMMSEIPEKKQDGPVDVVLEEIEKKKEADG
ncbi:MAG: hypothetical protein IKE81_09265 [Clostridia bacterium]|nr:hypothetical protein [Clostridia bacterium]